MKHTKLQNSLSLMINEFKPKTEVIIIQDKPYEPILIESSNHFIMLSNNYNIWSYLYTLEDNSLRIYLKGRRINEQV